MGSTKKPTRYFAIGDIHGCVRELHLLLAKLPLDQDSTLVFLGDYVSRGNHGRAVIDTILSLKKQYNVVALRGNHENMFLDFIDDPESPAGGMFILNGGASTLANYADESGSYNIPGEHVNFLRELPYFYETDKLFFVHAGVPSIPLSEIDMEKHREYLIWVRGPFLSSEYNWGKLVVHGHTPVREPTLLYNRVNVDTGCIYNGMLTAVELPALNFHCVRRNVEEESRVLLKDKGSNRATIRFTGELPVMISRNGFEIPFTTMNFSEFGLLLREATTPKGPTLAKGESVSGAIGSREMIEQVRFKGLVVRCEQRESDILYGLQIIELLPAQ